MLSRNNPVLGRQVTVCHQCRQGYPLLRGMGTVSNCCSCWSRLIPPEHRQYKSPEEAPCSPYVPSWSLVTDIAPAFHQLVGDRFLGRASRGEISLGTQAGCPDVLPGMGQAQRCCAQDPLNTVEGTSRMKHCELPS